MASKKSAGTSLAKYGDFTDDELAEDQKEFDSSGGNGVFAKPKAGKSVYRVIPPKPGKKWKRSTHVHYVDVPGADRVNFVCPKREKGEFCVVCKRIGQLLATGNQKDEKKAKDLQPKRRSFCNVIDRENPLDGPRVYAFGKQVEGQLLAMRSDPDLGGNFVDPINGIDIAIITSGTGMSTEYKVVAANKGKVCPLSEDQDEMNDWIENQHNLEKYAEVLDADEIEAMLKGEKVEPRREKREEPEPKKTAAKTVTKPASKAKKTVDEEIEDAIIIDDEDD